MQGTRRAPRVGTRFAGRYRIEGPGDRSGYATAYPALDERSGQRVTVLVLTGPALGALDRDALWSALFVGRQTDHPAIVSVIDGSVLRDGRCYLVRQVYRPHTLDSMVRGGMLGRGVVLSVFAEIADALAALHAAHRVHGDVRPENIVVERDASGETVARLAGAEAALLFRTGSLPEHVATFGTRAYVGPEQLWNAPVTMATDVYSLGVALLEALTGAPVATRSAAADASARVPSTVRSPEGVEPALAALIARMTAIDPRRRPSAGHVARVIATAAAPRLAASTVPQFSFSPVAPTLPDRRLPRPRDLARSGPTAERPPIAAPVQRRTTRWVGIGALAVAGALLLPVLSAFGPLSSGGAAVAAPAVVVIEPATATSPRYVGTTAPSAGATAATEPAIPMPVRTSIAYILGTGAARATAAPLGTADPSAAPTEISALPVSALPVTAAANSPTPPLLAAALPAPADAIPLVALPIETTATGPVSVGTVPVQTVPVATIAAGPATTVPASATATTTTTTTTTPITTTTTTTTPITTTTTTSATPTAAATATPAPTPTPTTTATPTPTATPTATPALTAAPTAAPTPSPTPSATATPDPDPTASPTPQP